MEENTAVTVIVPLDETVSPGAQMAAMRQIVKTYCRWQPCGMEIEGTTRKRFCSIRHQRKHWRMRKQRSVEGVAEHLK